MILGGSDILVPEDFDRNRFGLIPTLPDQSIPRPDRVPVTPEGDPQASTQPRVFLDSFDLADAEAVLIQKALDATDNNRTKASKLLGISDRTLRNKLNRPKS